MFSWFTRGSSQQKKESTTHMIIRFGFATVSVLVAGIVISEYTTQSGINFSFKWNQKGKNNQGNRIVQIAVLAVVVAIFAMVCSLINSRLRHLSKQELARLRHAAFHRAWIDTVGVVAGVVERVLPTFLLALL